MTEEQKRFNIALLPKDKRFIDQNKKLAQENFAAQAQEYLLGDNAWPHITLCQFESQSSQSAEIWTKVAPLLANSMSVRMASFYILPYENAYWIGLATQREPELISLHLAINEVLNSFGIKSNQPHSTYFPHITWARCGGEKPPLITVLPDSEFWYTAQLFELSLGESSPYGVYRQRLFPQ